MILNKYILQTVHDRLFVEQVNLSRQFHFDKIVVNYQVMIMDQYYFCLIDFPVIWNLTKLIWKSHQNVIRFWNTLCRRCHSGIVAYFLYHSGSLQFVTLNTQYVPYIKTSLNRNFITRICINIILNHHIHTEKAISDAYIN